MVRNYLKEVAGIDNNEFRRVEITISVAMAAAGSATDTYRVPAGHKLVLTGLRGHLAFLTAADWVAPANVPGIISAKAMNCKIKLENQDTHDLLTENEDLSLASLLAGTNGIGEHWREAPHTVPAGQTIKMTATLASGDAVVINNTEYGVVMTGILVKVP